MKLMLRVLAAVGFAVLCLEASGDDRLVVGTKIAPPFVIEGEDGSFSGISISLWESIASELDLSFEYRSDSVEGVLDGLESGRYDVAVAALTITPDRERRFDMTHGYYADGLGIAVPASSGGPVWARALRNLFTPEFLSAVGALSLLLFVVGFAVWVVERRKNSEQFDEKPRGVADGFWFAAVTMTTVGYGDKSPRTAAGKLLALVWMFASIIIISAFTGAIASALTTARIETGVRAVDDLPGSRVGAPAGSATVPALARRGVSAITFESVPAGLEALGRGELDAFVHDASILRYEVRRGYERDARVLGSVFDFAAYGLALPEGSELVEPVNRALLARVRSDAWEEALSVLLGGVP